MTATVSIVIPAYNNEQYLAETLDSVLAQTYPNLEVIIADHSSADGTQAIIDEYSKDARVRALDPTPAGGGAKANWNRVSQAATGDYIKLVCGDDLIYPELVARQVAALDAHPEAVLTASRRDIIDANGVPFVKGRGLGPLVGEQDGARAIRATVRAGANLFGEPACVLIRRAVLESVGWWDDASPYLIDEATYANVLVHGGFVGIDASLVGFRVSDSQWSVRLMREQAEQAAGFHGIFGRRHPDIVRPIDRRLGDANAVKAALMRRLAYAYLRQRMTKASAA
ncbi:MAG: glycosyltransferase family 2 protein [Microbacteriaceae bacterium]|nr:glycosyltransferase family 2 protein [Microbacteriaceae bacterium]MCL2794538.1 glycosyltransferase family 2 protein [Microbacteriaceae bacterium]